MVCEVTYLIIDQFAKIGMDLLCSGCSSSTNVDTKELKRLQSIPSILQNTLYCLQSSRLQLCIAKHLVWAEELVEDGECGVSRIHPVLL